MFLVCPEKYAPGHYLDHVFFDNLFDLDRIVVIKLFALLDYISFFKV